MITECMEHQAFGTSVPRAQAGMRACPTGHRGFYPALMNVAKRHLTVLSEIEQMTFPHPGKGHAFVMRVLDIVLSSFGILVCLAPCLAIATAIKIDSPGPVFYRQRRVGLRGKLFWLVKFRTMVANAEQFLGPVWATENDPRQTRFGAFLRRTKLDELSQLVNILLGSMTFVGPRPERPEFVAEFSEYMPAFHRRHEVKPGLTGLAQLHNGYDGSARHVYRKLRWDVIYMKRKSVRFDVWMLWQMVWHLLRITAVPCATSQKIE